MTYGVLKILSSDQFEFGLDFKTYLESFEIIGKIVIF